MKSAGKYPLAVVVGYGPNHKTATKLVASVFKKAGEESVMEKWFVQEGDIRKDAATLDALADFLNRHRVGDNVSYQWGMGCPHEEGIDYPEGEVCPQCPFWANLDRFTLEPKSLDLPLTPEQIMAGLSCNRETQPLLGFEAAERYREQMVEPFLEAVERVLDNPPGTTPDDAMFFSYALAFLVRWREPRVFPLIIRWLSLPGEGAFNLGADTVTEWGSRLLATICGGDLAPIKQLILNRDANEICRGQAIEALAILAAWNERPQAEMADYFGWLAREGLERESIGVWDSLLCACADIEATAVFEDLQRAAEADLLDEYVVEGELSDLRAEPVGARIADFAERQRPFEDVAEETRWWACFSQSRKRFGAGPIFNPDTVPEDFAEPAPYVPPPPPKPYIAPPKIGRNEPCPCGSGKKYKKCCGQ